PLKYTDPTGHENFFGGFIKAEAAAFNKHEGLFALGSAALFTGGLDAMSAITTLAVYAGPTTGNYVTGQILGQRAAVIGGAVVQICIGVAEIVVGAYLIWTGGGGWIIASGVLTIASASFSI